MTQHTGNGHRSNNLETLADELLAVLTTTLGVKRTSLPSAKDIQSSCGLLHQHMDLLRPRLEDPETAHDATRMCTALATGCLGNAITCGWNVIESELRRKLSNLCNNKLLPNIVREKISIGDEGHVSAGYLLDLCYKYGIVNEACFSQLDDCRRFRNEFSTAHPTMGEPDIGDVTLFLDEGWNSAFVVDPQESTLTAESLLTGIFSAHRQPTASTACEELGERIITAPAVQQVGFVHVLHGLYCERGPHSRVGKNIEQLLESLRGTLPNAVFKETRKQHIELSAAGCAVHFEYSCQFFASQAWLQQLDPGDVTHYAAQLCGHLIMRQEDTSRSHQTHAARVLAELITSRNLRRPLSHSVVQAVVACSIGDAFGRSYKAAQHCEGIIRNFTRHEAGIMMSLAESDTIVGQRVQAFQRCRERFAWLVKLLPRKHMRGSLRATFETWTAKKKS